MGNWSDFHSDPRKSYYLYLRQGYGYSAHEAHARVKRVDTMVTSLEPGSDRCAVHRSLESRIQLLRAVTACSMALQHVWASVAPGAARQGKARREVLSRFFHSA